MKTLKMSPAVRILLQIVIGTVFAILAEILVFSTLQTLPVIAAAFSSITPYFYGFVLVASFYLGSLLGIKILNAISGKKQKYTLSIMAIPLLTIPIFFLLDSYEEMPTSTLTLILYLVTPTLLMIVTTHLEAFLRNRYKLSYKLNRRS